MIEDIEKYISAIIQSGKYFSIGQLLYSNGRIIGTALHPCTPVTRSDVIAVVKEYLPFNSITGFNLTELNDFLRKNYPI